MKILIFRIFILFLLSLPFFSPAFGGELNSQPSISTILNEDGPVNTGVKPVVNSGYSNEAYRLEYTNSGEPRFFSSNKDMVAAWQTTFSSQGMDSAVYTFAVIGTDLYVGGSFKFAGNVSVNYIAKWDGAVWSALGTGMNASVRSLTSIGTNLYAGGDFTTAGGISANRVARWNGTSWSALSSGMDAGVYALTSSGTDLYAGGDFVTAGGVSANRVAKWNGVAWSFLGAGANNTVYALVAIDTTLYIGGSFTIVGGSSANYIAKWSGTTWTSLSSGTDGSVYSLAGNGTDVYAGGDFVTAGGNLANRIARWNGNTWSILGTGMDATVYSVNIVGNDLYVGGDFSTGNDVFANRIAKWDGAQFSSLGNGLNSSVRCIISIADYLYAGGLFTVADGSIPSNYIAQWQDVLLPVELTSFTSSISNQNVTLTWTTVMEENNSGYDIERNSIGSSWHKIGFVSGKGNSNQSQSYSYNDAGLNAGIYTYRLKQIDYNGNYKYYDLSSEVIIGVPGKFSLSQNYPNPFNPSTKINYELPFDSKVSIMLYDMSGKQVANIVNNTQAAGFYTVQFNASALSSGTYFYTIMADGGNNKFESTKKMILLK